MEVAGIAGGSSVPNSSLDFGWCQGLQAVPGVGSPRHPEMLCHLCSPPQVAASAGVYELLNQLGFPELEGSEDQPCSRLRYRWQQWPDSPEPSATGDFL